MKNFQDMEENLEHLNKVIEYLWDDESSHHEDLMEDADENLEELEGHIFKDVQYLRGWANHLQQELTFAKGRERDAKEGKVSKKGKGAV
jgi:hypothetical protein